MCNVQDLQIVKRSSSETYGSDRTKNFSPVRQSTGKGW